MLLGTQRVNGRGHLEIGGCDAVDLAREFGTPLYVMDEAAIRDNCRRYKAAFESRYPKNEFSFASKAYLNLAICKLMAQEGYGIDVASAGELYTALSAGFPAEQLLLHGNYKSAEELDMALANGVGRVVVDNFLELRMLAERAQQQGKTQKVLLRVTPGIDPKTHRRIRTGQEDTKFGFSISNGAALEAIREALSDTPHIEITGIHCHIGSQLLDAHTHQEAAEIMVGLMRTIADATGWMPTELDMGGGLGIKYLESQTPPTYEEFAEAMTSALHAALEKYDVPAPTLLHEPGRTLVGEAGTTLYTVGPVKHVPIAEAPGTRTYVAIDGGMSDNPRPQLYDAVYEVLVANKMGEAKDQTVRIAGKHCETDILIQETLLGHTVTGDILAVQSTGAYNYAMASNYNRFRKPACVFVQNGQADLVSRRETLDDLLRLDVLPERLG